MDQVEVGRCTMDTGIERWILRYRNFANALEQLRQACNLESYSKLERAGLVQTFSFTFELAWKMLKDLLFADGLTEHSPRGTLRQSLQQEYLTDDDCEDLLDALDKRNLLAHTYSEEAALLVEALIKGKYFPALEGLEASLKSRLDQ